MLEPALGSYFDPQPAPTASTHAVVPSLANTSYIQSDLFYSVPDQPSNHAFLKAPPPPPLQHDSMRSIYAMPMESVDGSGAPTPVYASASPAVYFEPPVQTYAVPRETVDGETILSPVYVSASTAYNIVCADLQALGDYGHDC